MKTARLLPLVRRLCVAGLCLAAGALPVAAAAAQPGTASTAGTTPLTSRAHVDFTVRVPRAMQLRLVDHPRDIHVTPEDVARGEVVVSGTRLAILANNRSGYQVRAELHGAAFAAVAIDGLPAPLATTGRSGAAYMPSQVGAPRPAPYPVSYRLSLAAGTEPGRYGWPVALDLQDP